MASNLPPGVTDGMIPGNRPEDEDWDSLFDEMTDWGMEPSEIRQLKARLEKAEAVVEAASWIVDCPYTIDEASVPKAGIEAAPPYQVVGNMSLLLTKRRALIDALKAYDAARSGGRGEGA